MGNLKVDFILYSGADVISPWVLVFMVESFPTFIVNDVK